MGPNPQTLNPKPFRGWHGFEPKHADARPSAAPVELEESKLKGYKFYLKTDFSGYKSKWYKTMKHRKKRFDIESHIWNLVQRSRQFVQVSAKPVAEKAKQLIETFQKNMVQPLQLHPAHAHAHHSHGNHNHPKAVMDYEKHFNVGAAAVHIGSHHKK